MTGVRDTHPDHSTKHTGDGSWRGQIGYRPDIWDSMQKVAAFIFKPTMSRLLGKVFSPPKPPIDGN